MSVCLLLLHLHLLLLLFTLIFNIHSLKLASIVRPIIMKTSLKSGLIGFTASAVSFGLGDLHFILKTSADAVARLEGNIIKGLIDKPIAHTIEDRHNQTEYTQELCKTFGSKVASKFRSITKPTAATETVADDVIHNAL